MFIKSQTTPNDYPVTINSVRDYLRITHTEQDSLLQNLIIQATQTCENFIGQTLISREMTVVADDFDYGRIKLINGPIIELVSIEQDGTEFDVTDFSINYNPRCPELTLKNGVTWPFTNSPITITYKAGFGENVEDVPADIRQGLLIEILNKFETDDGSSDGIANESMRLWKSHRPVQI